MKIAMISAGLIHRSLPYTSTSIRKHLLNPLQNIGELDVFFHSWNLAEINHSYAQEKSVPINSQVVEHYLPEAKGCFSSQEEFLQSFDFESFYKNLDSRIMSHHFSERVEKETTKALICFLESLKRAWGYAESQENIYAYDIIVFARCDVRYLHTLRPKIPHENEVYVPKSCSFRGCNDQFAYGTPKTMKIYFHRFDFLDQWTKNEENCESEKMTQTWLVQNGIKIKKIFFYFQRVRANGSIAKNDRYFVFHAWLVKNQWHYWAKKIAAIEDRAAKGDKFSLLIRKMYRAVLLLIVPVRLQSDHIPA
jgi:hypothetical protein